MPEADPPQDVGAEQAMIGAMLVAPGAVAEARRIVTVNDLYQPRHEVIFAAILDLTDAGVNPDAVVVLAELTKRKQATKAGGALYLHQLVSGVATAANVSHYAEQVRTASRRRQLVQVGSRLKQIGEEPLDLDDALTAAAQEALALDLLVEETSNDDIAGLETWADFLAQPDRPEDWIVPDLIERMNVIMVLARGGEGKSWLSRQICLCLSAGVHPFRPERRFEPVRTLLVDLENTPSMVRRQSRPLQSTIARMGTWDNDRAHIWAWPEGLNIRKHADAQLLERAIAQTRPAFVGIGSLWNLAQRGRDDWDTTAEETIAFLNRVRRRYRCAIMLEHHMPKGSENKTPFGSSAWERFVEYGRVLTRRGENVWELESSFRTDRDVREWPVGLYRGGALPWSPIYSQSDMEAMIELEEANRR